MALPFRTRRVLLVLSILATLLGSGCLRDDVFPEPYAWRSAELQAGQGEFNRPFDVPPAAQRVRFSFEVDVASTGSILSPAAAPQLRMRNPTGDVSTYNFTASGRTADTFGGPVGGAWGASFSDPSGASRYELALEMYLPKYEEWAWWKVWLD